ncbi:MAG: SDR family oxidoreductase [Verrucomicrobiota bacterium]
MSLFEKKAVWITGASSGIGEALAHAFAREEARLVISARDRDALDRVADNCLSRGASEKPLALPFDLGMHEAIEPAAREALNRCGRIDILVNNAGIGQRASAHETKPEVVRRIMDVNYLGPVFLTQAVLPSMLKQRSGRIVIVSSVLGKFHLPGRSAYVASKHALQGYFDTLRSELHGSGVGITLICPGWIETGISENALTANGDRHARPTIVKSGKMSADDCAKRILVAIDRGKREAMIGGLEIHGGRLRAAFPRIYDWITRGRVREFIWNDRL